MTRENPYVEVGSSPRGSLGLFKASKANAAIMGRDYVVPDDVKLFAGDVLRHRIILKMEYALEESISADFIVRETLNKIQAPTLKQ